MGADSEVEAGEAGSDSDAEPPGDWKESKKQRRRREEAEKKADRRGKKDKKKRKVSYTTRDAQEVSHALASFWGGKQVPHGTPDAGFHRLQLCLTLKSCPIVQGLQICMF